MPDFDTLQELLKDDVVLDLVISRYGKKSVTLTEPGNSHHTGYSVAIHNMPENAVVMKTDNFPAPKTFFKNTKGECKRADFVIIANTDKENLFILIEIKKGKGSSERTIIRQLQGAQCVIAYCRSIGQVFWQQKDFLNPEKYKYRFVSIRNIGINKKPTYTPHRDGLHDCPERMLKITSPHHLQFKQLAG
ncbi:MAG: hypothetical protein DRI57_27865 [Deltaproteobacteria bacterium]|nr:MAG: hypothetical protein DRI57_27865 [Deltaproteobacteria bacterium]